MAAVTRDAVAGRGAVGAGVAWPAVSTRMLLLLSLLCGLAILGAFALQLLLLD